MEIKQFTSVEEMEAVSELLSNLARKDLPKLGKTENRLKNHSVNSVKTVFAAKSAQWDRAESHRKLPEESAVQMRLQLPEETMSVWWLAVVQRTPTMVVISRTHCIFRPETVTTSFAMKQN
jgi:hypothetical protein